MKDLDDLLSQHSLSDARIDDPSQICALIKGPPSSLNHSSKSQNTKDKSENDKGKRSF